MPNLQKDYIDSFLNDLEKVHLQKFADDEQMKAVVKKVLLGGVYENGTLKAGKDPKPAYNCAFGYIQYADGNNVEVSDEQVGANIRALYEGIKALEYAFKVIEDYRTPDEKVGEQKNKAR